MAQEKPAAAQSPSFGVGDQALALGFGLGIRYGYPDNTAISPSTVVIYDVGLVEVAGPGTMSIGGIAGFKTARFTHTDASGGRVFRARWNNYLIGARAAYHFALGPGFERLDLYAGIMAGFRFQRFSRRESFGAPVSPYLVQEFEQSQLRPIVGSFGGGRYNFTDQLGAWLEIGYDVSLIKAGLHVNF